MQKGSDGFSCSWFEKGSYKDCDIKTRSHKDTKKHEVLVILCALLSLWFKKIIPVLLPAPLSFQKPVRIECLIVLIELLLRYTKIQLAEIFVYQNK